MGAKAIAILLFISALVSVIWYYGNTCHQEGMAEVQALWDKDKAERKVISDNQAREARERERVANETSAKIAADYAVTRKRLNAALARLRGAQSVPREDAVQMAADRPYPMPNTSESPKGTDGNPQAAIGTKQSIEYGDAMSDTLQCSSLIAWVCNQGMCQQ